MTKATGKRRIVAYGDQRKKRGATAPASGLQGMKWPEVKAYVKKLASEGLDESAIWGELAMRENYKPKKYDTDKLVPIFDIGDVRRALREE